MATVKNCENKGRSLVLEGIYPPLPTSFDDKGEVDRSQMGKNIECLNRFDLRGYVVMGSNGEYVSLTESEKRDVLEIARDAIPGDKLMIAGTGCHATRETVKLTKAAASIGADAALVVNPSYYKNRMTHAALIRHFSTVADFSPIPVLIYNVPPYTGIDLPAETIASLADHPNIVGMKESGGNLVKMGNIRGLTGADFQILSGSAGNFLPALSVGAMGGIFALANIAPLQCLAIHQYFKNNEMERARDVQVQMIPLNTAVTSEWGVPGLKAAMDLLGLYGGPVRLPLLPVSDEIKDKIEKIIINTNIKKMNSFLEV